MRNEKNVFESRIYLANIMMMQALLFLLFFLPGRGGMLATTLATAEEAESLDIFLYYYL